MILHVATHSFHLHQELKESYRYDRFVVIGIFTAIAQGSTISGIAIANVIPSVVTPPTQFGLFGNINTAALMLTGAMITSVMITKYQKVQIEQIPEIQKK
jgi:hypothetical protein